MKHLVEKIELLVNLDQEKQLYFGCFLQVNHFESFTDQVTVDSNEGINVYHKRLKIETMNRKLEAMMIEQLSDYIERRVIEYTKILNVQYNQISYKNYRASWGKCTSHKDLFFSKKLIFTSYEFIDYVVLHECTHLLHFNHSSRFYQTIEKIMPDYKNVILRNKQMMIISEDF